MRQLKFRIWNYVEAKWNGLYHNTPKMVGELCCLKGIYLIPESTSRNHILEQYTGLKDKNGKEIYEGDIVKYARSKVESIESPKGVFSGKLIELGEDIGEIAFMGFEYVVSFDHKRYDDIEKLGNYPHRFEVIGNIHENPELLK